MTNPSEGKNALARDRFRSNQLKQSISHIWHHRVSTILSFFSFFFVLFFFFIWVEEGKGDGDGHEYVK